MTEKLRDPRAGPKGSGQHGRVQSGHVITLTFPDLPPGTHVVCARACVHVCAVRSESL